MSDARLVVLFSNQTSLTARRTDNNWMCIRWLELLNSAMLTINHFARPSLPERNSCAYERATTYLRVI